ncbi:UNVERIFIED_CONTAM: putative mitochondrial protein [Sesamum radiatum]|uniref:Mitochondrial protein n=1 Tax=Sesamum radiatum TaxID=300843 RepID=A0AAW2S6P1_SESRA
MPSHIQFKNALRACANSGWTQLFPNASVTHLPVTCSDHVALLIRLVDRPVLANKGFRPWRFEAAWLQSEKCEQAVLASWALLDVFASSHPRGNDIANGIEHLRSVVDASMADDLLQPYTETEVTTALFQMAPLKSPGPDGGQGYMALKLDVSKAYDKVEGTFLERVLFKLGFPPCFIRLVMLCVSSVSYSFMLGGCQFGTLIPERGLRQGDPLSPYLFLLCTEVFSSIIQRAEADGRIRGVLIYRGAPHILHLLFADDTLIFCQASLEGSCAIREVLESYRRASGQEINFNKSSVAFSRNMRDDLCSHIGADLNIRLENKMELYLGLPSKVARLKKELFSIIRDRIWKHITGWNEKLLSQAGKGVLIKSIVQAIPTYAMSCF